MSLKDYHQKIELLILVLVCLALPKTVLSQTNMVSKTASVQGKIVSNNQTGVIAATVFLLNSTDSSIVQNGLSNIEGLYKFTTLSKGNYILKISHLEHQIYFSDSFDLNTQEQKTLPNFVLIAVAKNLNEVVVTASKPMIEVRADKIIFNVASSPSASGTNGLDLLKKAPGVKLDLDNNISLLGKDGVQIYINGVPSRLSGDDLSAYLQSMTSDNIEMLEIISNPSSKYDAEGTGGIINIKTKKNVASGFKGSATSSFTQGVLLQYSNSLSLNYGSEKLKTNLDITQSDNPNLEIFTDNKVIGNTILDLKSRDVQATKGLNINFGTEYQINKNQVLNFNAQTVLNQRDFTLNSNTNIFDVNPQQFKSILNSQSFLDAPSTNYNFNLSHRISLNKTSNLNTSLSIGTFKTDRNTDQPNSYYRPDGTTVISTNNTAFDANTDINLWSAKVDYDKEWEKINFSAGAKYGYVFTDNDFTFYNVNGANQTLDPLKSNTFSYLEKVAAAYTNLNLKINKSLSANLGMRVENTSSRGLLISQTTVNDKDVPRNYTNLFPNLSLNYDNQKNSTFNLSYGKRITRPNYQNLNPFESPTSLLVTWKGNPFLKPNYSYNYQFTYGYKQKLIISTTYTQTKDYFATLFEDIGNGATQVIPRNLDNINTYALSISYPIQILKNWEVQGMANASRQEFSGNLEGTIININANLWDYSIQNNINLPAGILMNISYFQQSNWVWRGSILISGTSNLDFGIRKDFFAKRLQVRITGADIFRTTTDYPYDGDYGGILLKGVYTSDQQRFGAGFTWKFGNQKVKAARKVNGLDDELKRL